MEKQPLGGRVTPTLPEGRDQLPLAAPHLSGHLVGPDYSQTVLACYLDKLLSQAVQHASPHTNVLKVAAKWNGQAVNHQKADFGVLDQEV